MGQIIWEIKQWLMFPSGISFFMGRGFGLFDAVRLTFNCTREGVRGYRQFWRDTGVTVAEAKALIAANKQG